MFGTDVTFCLFFFLLDLQLLESVDTESIIIIF